MLLDPRDVGKAISRIRGNRTQSAVAELGGLPASQWSIYESGRRLPKSDTLPKIIKGLGCTEDMLLEETIKARTRRLRGDEPASSGRGYAVFPQAEQPDSDLQPLLTELRSLRRNLSVLATYFIGLERRIEQRLGELPAPEPVQPS